MVTLTLIRKANVLTEEYGKVSYDGSEVHFEGLSCVFIKYLQRGIKTDRQTVVKPEDGKEFMDTFRDLLANGAMAPITIKEI